MPLNEDREVFHGKLMLVFGALFLVSCFMVWSEIAYILYGKQTTATVVKSFESTSRGRLGASRGSRVNIEYTFTEADGRVRKDILTMSGSSEMPAEGESIPIQYTPGELGRSRLVGQVSWLWIMIFAASVLGLVIFGIMMHREAHHDSPPRKKR